MLTDIRALYEYVASKNVEDSLLKRAPHENEIFRATGQWRARKIILFTPYPDHS